MDVREKLVELMLNVRSRSSAWETNGDVADYLIAHGVTVLPCNIGERVFCILHNKNEIVEDIVEDYDIWSIKDGVKLRISLLNHKDYVVAEFGKTIFLTREEAEKELEGGAGV